MLGKKVRKAFITVDQNQFKELKISMMLNQQMLQPMCINQKTTNQQKQNTRSVYHVSNRKNQNAK